MYAICRLVASETHALGVEEEAAGGDDRPLGAVDLPVAGSALELVDGFADVARSLGAALGQRATVRVHRDPAVDQDAVRRRRPSVDARNAPASPGPQNPAFSNQFSVMMREPVVREVDVDSRRSRSRSSP